MEIGLPFVVAMQKGAFPYQTTTLKHISLHISLYQILFNIVVAFGNAVKG